MRMRIFRDLAERAVDDDFEKTFVNYVLELLERERGDDTLGGV